MGVLEFVASLFTPITNLFGKVVDKDENIIKAQNELEKIKADVSNKLVEYDTKVVELQAKLMETASQVAIAESKSESWLTRNYRPMIITGMFLLICSSSFGLLKFAVPTEFFTIFGSAFGVLSLGRTYEKVKKGA